MNEQPAFDRSLIPPALIGIFSVFGICLVLMIYRYNTSREVISVTVTNTPFRYIFLGTEPAISTEPTPEVSGTPTLSTNEPQPSPRPTRPTQGTPILLTPGTPGTGTATNLSTTSIVITASFTTTPTSAAPPPLNPGTYDDRDYRLIYSGWDESQSGTTTLHVSQTLANPRNTVTFRFIGQQMILIYQPAPGLGMLQIMLDSTQYQLDESTGSGQRILTATSSGTHTVIITHVSGGAVNLDSVIIPLGITPTPTGTGSS